MSYVFLRNIINKILMKKVLIIITLLLSFVAANAQYNNGPSTSDLRTYSVTQNPNVPFRLFPTQNSWNFMKLDTRTGQIWMVQYSVESSSNAFTWTVNDIPIEDATSENIGRFTLYPTSNRFNFILLDQFNGNTWQVQYSLDKTENNFRVRIY